MGSPGRMSSWIAAATAVAMFGAPLHAEPPPAAEPVPAATAPAAQHNCKHPDPKQTFRVTLPKEATLDDLVHWMMSTSCKKFLWDPAVRGGKVNVLAPQNVTLAEADALFDAALHTMGLTVEPAGGDSLRIVESGDAHSRNLPVYGPDDPTPEGDRFVTQLVRVGSGNAAEIAKLLENLKGKQGTVVQVGETLIVTDTGNNVRRILGVIEQLDAPDVAREKIFFHQLRHADAEETAVTIREVFGEAAAAAKTKAKAEPTRDASVSRVIVDARTGTLILVTNDDDWTTVKKLIERIDVPVPGGTGRLRVIELKHADPEEIANVLTQIAAGGSPTRAKDGKTPVPNAGTLGQSLSGEIRVTADPASHSIVVLASQADFEAVKEVVAALDRERRQVYIEVYLLELVADNDIDAGAGAHFGKQFDAGDGKQGLGFVSSTPDAGHSSMLVDPSLLSGLAAGVLGPVIPAAATGLGVDIPAFGVVIQALHSRDDVNIVSEPHLYTSDNKEAVFSVGKVVPTPGAQTTATNPFNAIRPIERIPVRLKITVKPHVNDDRTVTLDIELENGGIEGAADPDLGVTTTERMIKLDDVVARDDQPLVLGGLIQEIERENTKQVPGLGSIPLLGWLFKSKKREKSRSNLLMVLVPHVIDSPEDARKIHQRRMAERLEFLERYSAFKRRDLETSINYSKKSGLLAAVNEEVGRMEAEDAARRIAEDELRRVDTSGELGDAPAKASPVPAEPSTPSEPAPRPAPATMPSRKPGS